MFFPLHFRTSIDAMWVEFRKLPPYAVVMQEQRRRILITTLWFGSTLLMAVFVPNIGAVIAVLGCLAALFIFAFPGKCYAAVEHYFIKYIYYYIESLDGNAIDMNYNMIHDFFSKENGNLPDY